MNKAYQVCQQARRFIQREALVRPGQRVLLAVSGGPDSMALLYIMVALRGELGIELAVAHLNHGLRPEAASEEDFVRSQAAGLGIPFFSRQLDVREMAARQGLSLEEAGRLARYAYFEELAVYHGFNRVATGHHRGDVAETLLHHLLRGSGMRGLQGILPRRGKLIRPLLELDKSDLEACLAEAGLPCCRDLSNDEDIYTRNHIRHHLIPFLQAHYNPSIIETLNQTAAILREETACLDQILQTRWPLLVLQEDSQGIALDAAALAALPLALGRRGVMKALERMGGQEKWTMKDVDAVLGLLGKSGSSKSLNLKSGLVARKDYGSLKIARCRPPVAGYCYPVTVPGIVRIPETGRCYEFILAQNPGSRPRPGDFLLDWELLEPGLQLRSRRPGDRFQPHGLNGRKKVKDYYIDARISVEERERIPILCSSQGRVLALVGLRADASVHPRDGSSCLLIIRRLD